MAKQLSVHEKRSTKPMKKKPVKVVYIGNPLKFETSASNFRALVQQLTGRNSVMPEPIKFHVRRTESSGSEPADDPDKADVRVRDEHTVVDIPNSEFDDVLVEPYGKVLMHPMFEDFPGLLPSNLYD